MRIIIEINTAGVAFDVDPMAEAAAIIADAVTTLEDIPVGSRENLYDIYGFRCGFVEVASS